MSRLRRTGRWCALPTGVSRACRLDRTNFTPRALLENGQAATGRLPKSPRSCGPRRFASGQAPSRASGGPMRPLLLFLAETIVPHCSAVSPRIVPRNNTPTFGIVPRQLALRTHICARNGIVPRRIVSVGAIRRCRAKPSLGAWGPSFAPAGPSSPCARDLLGRGPAFRRLRPRRSAALPSPNSLLFPADSDQ